MRALCPAVCGKYPAATVTAAAGRSLKIIDTSIFPVLMSGLTTFLSVPDVPPVSIRAFLMLSSLELLIVRSERSSSL